MNRINQEQELYEEQDYKPKSLKSLLKLKKPAKHKIDYSFQDLGIEMQSYFKKIIWYLFHKYDELKIRDAFKICKEKGIKKVNYLVGIIKHIT